MNTNFMRLLALRLERLSVTEVVPEECRIVEHFDSMDGFLMSSDLMFWNRPPGFVFGDDDYFVGGIEDWAVQLIQEQGGYYNESGENGERSDNWVDVQLDDEFSQRHVWRLACRALGLGKGAEAGAIVAEDRLPHALFHPSRLYGRMQSVTPRMAAEVLHSVAEELWPEAAWRWIDMEIRRSRLKQLANIVEKTEAGMPLREVENWNHAELEENLTHFSMLNSYAPGVVESGAWCGGLAVWAYKLWGANAHLWFGPEAARNLLQVSSTLLGLAGLEGRSLFEAAVAPRIQGDADAEGWRGRLTPETASEVLGRVAHGVFPSATWEDIRHHQSLGGFADSTGMNGGS